MWPRKLSLGVGEGVLWEKKELNKHHGWWRRETMESGLVRLVWVVGIGVGSGGV